MISKHKVLIVAIIILDVLSKNVHSRVRFTNIVCTNLDPSYIRVSLCKVRAVSRDVNYMNIKVELLQVPVTDFEVRVQIMKKANGWKPFLYDVTMRCNFTKKLNPITKLIWSAVKDFSNVKHDCPYNQSLEVNNLSNTLIADVLTGLPVPQGEYGFFTTWKSYNITRGKANFYGIYQ